MIRIVFTALALALVSACQTTSTPTNTPQAADGTATVRCRADDRGQLKDCRVVSELAAGQGFGEAAVRTVMRGRVDPAQGTLPANAEFDVTVHFQIVDGRLAQIPPE